MTIAPTATKTTGQSTIAIALALAAMFGFAVMDGLTKILSSSLPITQILWVRSIIFCAVIMAIMSAQKHPLRALLRSERPGLQFSRALLLVFEGGAFMLAFKLMPLANVHAIGALSPLLVVALSVPLLGETVGWRRWSAVIAGFGGVLLIVRPGYVPLEPAAVIAWGAAALWAIYQVMVRLCARTDSSETTSLWTAVVGFLATTLLGPTMWIWPDVTGWGMLAAISLLGSLAHMSLIRALSMTQPSLLQPYNYSLFVWAVVVGYLFFGDVPDVWTWAGAAIIIASGIYVWHRERLRSASRPQSAQID